MGCLGLFLAKHSLWGKRRWFKFITEVCSNLNRFWWLRLALPLCLCLSLSWLSPTFGQVSWRRVSLNHALNHAHCPCLCLCQDHHQPMAKIHGDGRSCLKFITKVCSSLNHYPRVSSILRWISGDLCKFSHVWNKMWHLHHKLIPIDHQPHFGLTIKITIGQGR